jgi:hypothetical protein
MSTPPAPPSTLPNKFCVGLNIYWLISAVGEGGNGYIIIGSDGDENNPRWG